MYCKKKLANDFCSKLESGIVLGLGTGTTVEACIDVLALKGNLNFKDIIVSSIRTKEYCLAKGIKTRVVGSTDRIDVYVDGVDQIDRDFIALKGRGGAMTGERLCMQMAIESVFLLEEEKYVPLLGGAMPLPIEVVSWARSSVAKYLISLGGRPILREGKTDLGNDILDCYDLSYAQPFNLAKEIASRCGVISHGLFADALPNRIIIGESLGCKHIKRQV